MLSKSPRERKILYGSTDMWNLKKKKLVDTDREQIGIARGRDEGGENGWRGWKHWLPVIR